MSNNESEGGFFENVLMFIGGYTGAILGSNEGDFLSVVIGAIILGGLGKIIGRLADQLIKIIALIVIILMNRVIRQFLWRLLLQILQIE